MTELKGVSQDDFLGGAIKLFQPEEGYRIATDTVFLAASIICGKRDRILDVGAGTGGILSCLSSRLSSAIGECELHGLELQQELLDVAKLNAEINGFGEKITYFPGDIAKPPSSCMPNSYDQVITNPPYLKKDGSTISPYETRAVAHTDSHLDLEEWVRFSLRMLKPLGFLTLIHRADRLDDIIAALHGRAGDMVVFPLWPAGGKDARRVIIRARKGGKGKLVLKPGLIVHKSDGSFTPEAENILRHGTGLDIEKQI